MHDSNQNCLVPILDRNIVSKSRPSENSLADFCTSALLKALNLYSKKANFQAFSSAEVYKLISPLENFHMVSTLD